MNTVTVTSPTGQEYNFLFGTWSKRRFMELCKDFETVKDDQFTIGQLSLDISFAVVAAGIENYRKVNGNPTAVVTPFDASIVIDDLGGEDSELLRPVFESFQFFNKEAKDQGEAKETQPPKKASRKRK